jgi:F-type H+-transporting ATPase subunit epsilon
VITIKTVVDGAPGETLRAALHGGFISVANDRVSLLSEAAELVEEIDADRAQEALTRARAGEFGADSEAAAARAELRLRAVGRGE